MDFVSSFIPVDFVSSFVASYFVVSVHFHNYFPFVGLPCSTLLAAMKPSHSC